MRARLTSSRFVGRVGELAELELALREATAGTPAVVLLGGESGVGKTRLVTELQRRLADADEPALVLRGESVEQRDGELPYAPLLSALRPVVRERHPAFERLSSVSRADLATLLPALASSGPSTERDGSTGQIRLFEALLELLDLFSESQPVLLVLEDMHWADRSTRAFASFAASSLREERLVMLLTYRTDELHRRHPLLPLLAELERLERTQRIVLSPFDRVELAEALADILGNTPSPQLVERLFERGEGNPLYTEELLAAGLDGRGAAPETLRQAFMLRIERLAEDAQRVARVVAVGRRLDNRTIAEVTGLDVSRLQGALRDSVSEQVLVARDDDRFEFRHALLREALYEDLLPGERSELHLALARVLETGCEEEDKRELERTTAIASHYEAAGEQPAALKATVRAARAAFDVQAFGEAGDLAERALELWPRVSDAEDAAELDHVELLSLAAEANAEDGHHGRAEGLRREALEELDPERDPRRCSALLGQLARTQWALNRGEQAVQTAERALALLPGDDRGLERAKMLAWLARNRFLRGRFREAIKEAGEALSIAVDGGHAAAEAETLNTLGMAMIALGRVDEGLAHMQRTIEIARETGDLDTMTYGYSNMADMLSLAGRTEEALRVAHEGLAVMPARLRADHDWIALTVSEMAFEAGDWTTARRHLKDPPPSWLLGRQLIFRRLREADQALGVGDEDGAAEALEAIASLVAASPEPQWIALFGALSAELLRRRRDLDGARKAAADALDRIELCTDDVARIARVTAIGMVVESDRAQRARDLREKAAERDALAYARIHIDRLRAAAEAGGPLEHAWLGIGNAELTRARGRSDPAKWLTAASEWEALARPYWVAIARWRAAEALADGGDRAGASEVARPALETARGLGSEWLTAQLTGLASRARLDVEPERNGDGTSPPDEDGDPFGLTPRERQVLTLLAEGATNRQIGTALYMAEKTASVHVSRILSKLGVNTRTQAAAVAHRQHLD
jgi:DNA-binding CsgD family transcriptional regulator/tetratricopeptide (TPR) repeat protein